MSQLLASIHSTEELLEKIPDAEARLKGLFDYLAASERQLAALIGDVRRGAAPAKVDPGAEGDLEFGLVLYWLAHPESEVEAAVAASPAHALATLALRRFAPATAITSDLFGEFRKSAYDVGVVAADGTLWTLGKYAQLDPYWLTAAVNYAINLLDPASIHQPYPEPGSAYRAAVGPGSGTISIAVVGDWGTGPYGKEFGGQGPAVAVMNGIRGLRPDYVVHLGDVYYCGTDDRLPRHEERDNLLAPWNSGQSGAGRNFTINSNHEMYGAAQGLIEVALAAGTPFGHQNGIPYFALEFGSWGVIGLDSAYFDPSHLYMKGALGNADNTQQKGFVGGLDLTGKKILVMTHHNAMSYDGSAIVENPQAGVSLWEGMVELLGRQPDLWYWGHLHLGVAYNRNSVLGAKGTVCRCIGHGAIPFGDASGIDRDKVDYYAHTPLAEGSKQVRNGFAVLTLEAGGGFSEAFYEVTGEGACVEAWRTSS